MIQRPTSNRSFVSWQLWPFQDKVLVCQKALLTIFKITCLLTCKPCPLEKNYLNFHPFLSSTVHQIIGPTFSKNLWSVCTKLNTWSKWRLVLPKRSFSFYFLLPPPPPYPHPYPQRGKKYLIIIILYGSKILKSTIHAFHFLGGCFINCRQEMKVKLKKCPVSRIIVHLDQVQHVLCLQKLKS